ncbi:MAG: MFS transporter, partial [Microcoleus sp. SIO2G3]|nr:MFS transporter [Microcoleus sp. SIO2G3]
MVRLKAIREWLKAGASMNDGWRLALPNKPWSRKLLALVNIRPEEVERTFLLFAFYTATSIGVLWLEISAAALFINEYGAESLPWIYIASAGIGAGLGFFYSLLQKLLPLRRVIVLTAVLMAVPLLLFRMEVNPAVLGGYGVFLMRLWLEAVYVLNELNTSITANQLFNIREIKRTYPLISSGILAADVLSGVSLPLLRSLIGLQNIILLASLMLFVGAGILAYISQVHQQFFPDSRRRRLQEQPETAARRLRGPLRRYVVLLVAFFVMVQVLWLLIDFQYLSQIEESLNAAGGDVGEVADFLALFSSILGLFELLTQWFISSRAIERLGVFVVTTIPPALIVAFSLLSLSGLIDLFLGLILLKFLDELLRYTLLASTGPVLFQPVPDMQRSRVQSIVRGIAEPISTGLTGLGMLATIWLCRHLLPAASELRLHRLQSLVFVAYIGLFAAIWLATVLMLRSRYTGLLVLGAERGDLSLADVDPRSLRRAVLDTLERPGAEIDKASSIELLSFLDAKAVGEVLAPLLPTLTPALQRQALEEMLKFPNLAYLDRVRALLQ